MVFCTTLWFSRRENHEKTIVWESNPMARTAKVKKKKLAPFKPHKSHPENPKNHQKCEILRKNQKTREIARSRMVLFSFHGLKGFHSQNVFKIDTISSDVFRMGDFWNFSKHFFILYNKTNEFLLWKKNWLQNLRISDSR